MIYVPSLVSLDCNRLTFIAWRINAPKTIHIDVRMNGKLDVELLYKKIDEYKDTLAAVAITGASNVTGYLNPIYEIARKVHSVGGLIAVDCAQLIAHRPIYMKPLSDPEHLDFISFSGHKMYAPFGGGSLVGRRDAFEKGAPDYQGGGAADWVGKDEIAWSKAPAKDEAGTPNIFGAIAIHAAIRQLQVLGMDFVAQHEAELTEYALRKLAQVPGIKFFHDFAPETASSRVGIITFTLDNVIHTKVAAILGYEFGIGVRSGCFCAHPLVYKILEIPDEYWKTYAEEVEKGLHPEKPGLIRCSFGLFNSEKDVDALFNALMIIAKGEYKGKYILQLSGEYEPENWDPKVFDEHVAVRNVLLKPQVGISRFFSSSKETEKAKIQKMVQESLVPVDAPKSQPKKSIFVKNTKDKIAPEQVDSTTQTDDFEAVIREVMLVLWNEDKFKDKQ